jgi:pyruvate dehydrogenase E2 component (dihydrolipoyllysine-residue acetyltransferase)
VVDFRMPSLGADMEAGTLVEWLVKPGDRVKRGDIVAVVETQKGAIEIEIFETGQIEQVLVGLNSKVPVGTPLARIRTELEAKFGGTVAAPIALSTGVPAAAPSTLPPAPRSTLPQPALPPMIVLAETARRARVSPAARRLAQMRGVDLGTITGSGPAGAIIRADVEHSFGAISSPTEKKHVVGLDLEAMRAAIAAAMARSKREIPLSLLKIQFAANEGGDSTVLPRPSHAARRS